VVLLRCLQIGRDAPATDFAGYPANLKAGYRISGAGRIPDIKLDFQLHTKMSSKIVKDIRCIAGFLFPYL
jgi:hypothetical protein